MSHDLDQAFFENLFNDLDQLENQPPPLPVVEEDVKKDVLEVAEGGKEKDRLEHTDPDVVADVLTHPGRYTDGEVFALKNFYFHKDQSGAQYLRRALYGKKVLDVLYKSGLITDYKAAFLMVGDINMDVCQGEGKGKCRCGNPAVANSFFCGKHRKGRAYDDGLTAMVTKRRRELEEGGSDKERVSISRKRAKKATVENNS
jgi:hypothetical protein